MEFEDLLNINYDGNGELISSHQMDSELVADSLKAINVLYKQSFMEAQKLLNDRLDISLFVDARKHEQTFQEGSLKWLLRLVGSQPESQSNLGQDIPTFFRVQQAIKNTIQILKRFRYDDAVIKVNQTRDGYSIEVDGESVSLNDFEYALLTNEEIRKAISNLSQPLLVNGIDSFSLSSSSLSDGFSISREDAINLVVHRQHKIIVDEGEFEDTFYIENLSYNPESKWRLISTKDKNRAVSGIITDSSFLKRVSLNQEKFAKDDLIRAKVNYILQKSKLTGNTVYTYTITDILEHIPVRGSQGKLI